jgi:tight adherence protein C
MHAGVARFDALRGLARRTGVDELYALVAMLIQTDRLGNQRRGGPAAHAAVDAHPAPPARRAARAPGRRQARVPLVLLILPALLRGDLGPAAIQITKALDSRESSFRSSRAGASRAERRLA